MASEVCRWEVAGLPAEAACRTKARGFVFERPHWSRRSRTLTRNYESVTRRTRRELSRNWHASITTRTRAIYYTPRVAPARQRTEKRAHLDSTSIRLQPPSICISTIVRQNQTSSSPTTKASSIRNSAGQKNVARVIADAGDMEENTLDQSF